MDDRLSSEIWKPVLRAVNAAPQDVQAVRGLSGLEHPCIALGVDEKERRLVVVSAEADARSAALAQADIQAALPDIRVVVARPVAFDMAQLAEGMSAVFGAPEFGPEQLKLIDPENQERGFESRPRHLEAAREAGLRPLGPLGG